MRLILSIILLLPCAMFGAENRADPEKVQSIIRLAKFADQMAAISEMTVAQYARNLNSGEKELIEKLSKIVSDAYAPKSLIDDFTRCFAEELTPSQIEEILKWLESDLGRKTSEEETASLAEQKKPGFVLPSFEALPDARKVLVRKLAESIAAGEFSARLARAPARTMMEAQQRELPQEMKLAKDALEKMISDMQKEAEGGYSGSLLSTIAFTYRNLSEDELSQIIVFYGTPAGKNLNQASQEALLAAMNSAAGRMGRGQASIIMYLARKKK